MDRGERDRLVAMYEDGFNVVTQALAGASDAEMHAREAAGEWSPIEIIHHLADSEMHSAIRLRRLIAEDEPVLQAYDQDEYMRRLFYDRPIDESLATFRAARSSTAQILHRLTEADWERAGSHTEIGRFTVLDWLRAYGVHAHEHADQIRRARATAG